MSDASVLYKLTWPNLQVRHWLPQRPGVEEAVRNCQWELAERLARQLAVLTTEATTRAGLLAGYVSVHGGPEKGA